MTQAPTHDEHRLRKSNLKQLRLPTIGAEFEKLGREAAEENGSYGQYLLQLTELEVAARQSNALASRIKQAGFPSHKDLDSFDFTSLPSLNRQQVLELTRSQWIEQHHNACLIGNSGTGKTHVATALSPAASISRSISPRPRSIADSSASSMRPTDRSVRVWAIEPRMPWR